jgi:hypothetical protein
MEESWFWACSILKQILNININDLPFSQSLNLFMIFALWFLILNGLYFFLRLLSPHIEVFLNRLFLCRASICSISFVSCGMLRFLVTAWVLRLQSWVVERLMELEVLWEPTTLSILIRPHKLCLFGPLIDIKFLLVRWGRMIPTTLSRRCLPQTTAITTFNHSWVWTITFSTLISLSTWI